MLWASPSQLGLQQTSLREEGVVGWGWESHSELEAKEQLETASYEPM